ncbi:MAG: FAD-dependent oxidoreductase, partial [Thiothrix sp.]|nr:FAD-dependent oxidoreductase [Thiothrix sp.]
MSERWAVAVLGGGIVGVSTALTLRERGVRVVLLEQRLPVRETSYGNAGILSSSSILPLNNPALFKALPGLLTNRRLALRYDPLWVLRHAGWFWQFLSRGRADNTEPRARALHALISRSQLLHREWLAKAGELQRLRTNGWLQVYRRPDSLAGAREQATLLDRFGIGHEWLSVERLRSMEPALKPVFAGGWWIRDTASVDNPGAVVDAYTRRYRQLQGVVQEGTVTALVPQEDHWQVQLAGGLAMAAQQVVVALGPWSRTFLQPLGLRLPM